MTREIFIGHDAREQAAYDVCEYSIRKRASCDVKITALKSADLIAQGLYSRPVEIRDGIMYDTISQAPQSTDFANTRWLTPFLAKNQWSLFMDSDMLIMDDIDNLFELCDDRYAVMCVKHSYEPEFTEKMDGQIQTQYPRKNWSSFVLFNKLHPANQRLTSRLINSMPGKHLHAFCWLDDNEIGALPEEWNWLEGHSKASSPISNIHFTRGGPWFPQCQDVGYADIWLRERDNMLGKIGKYNIVNPVENGHDINIDC